MQHLCNLENLIDINIAKTLLTLILEKKGEPLFLQINSSLGQLSQIKLVLFQQFQILWTLFSEFFSSFPRGTCSLSVSYEYLALDGVYHLIYIALSSNMTRPENTLAALASR